MPTYATFPSRCMACGETIEDGEPIVVEDNQWVHEACAMEDTDGFLPTLDEDVLTADDIDEMF
jgi:hypothetical protein